MIPSMFMLRSAYGLDGPWRAFLARFPGLVAMIAVSLLCSCSYEPEEKADMHPGAYATGINAEHFGWIDSTEVIRYTLVNPNGTMVKILNYGGIITSIMVPDRTGKPGDIVLGFDSLSGYLQKENPYLGALVGRYGNRIAHAQFALDGKTYTLAANNGPNTLHGGLRGFDKHIWKAKPLAGDSLISLELEYLSRDGEEGFPGNLQARVVYSLTPDNALCIEYEATTDKPTPVNLTNHSYFNLSAGKDSTILGETMQLNAGRFTQVNDELIPNGKLPEVRGGPMDFTVPKKIGNDLQRVTGGYDHNFVLNKTGAAFTLAATAYDSLSGRLMEMYTTEPGVQFYTGNFLDGKLTGKGGKRYVQHAGFCLEAQHFPDSPNQPSFPNTILRPGEKYHQRTIYKFSTR